ncbi:MAG: hypothetical protein Q9201_001410 [Fulgogasparrea decipioides]
MPNRESPSPARGPQLSERSASVHSLSRASPSTGQGSIAKSHKTHAVGHGRHPHGRAPSGRNLNKLGKLAATHLHEEHAKPKGHPKPKGQTPSTSPSTVNMKRNSSNISLARNGSKISIKKTVSNLSQTRNKSSSKLGNLTKTDMNGAERESSGEQGSGHPQFSIGSDDQEDDWVEADSSQSPDATRRAPVSKGQTQPREPPSPDEPPIRSSANLPASPPQSPPSPSPSQERADHRTDKQRQESGSHYSHPPDAELVTNRLLNRNTLSNAKPQTSAISATITPSVSSGSPAFNYSQDATLKNDQSMPPDGISRFLNTTGSSSGSATPNSISQLQSTLAEIHKEHQHLGNIAQHSPGSPSPSAAIDRTRRARSAGNLTTNKRSDQQISSSGSASPPSQHSNHSTTTNKGAIHHPSPFTSAQRDHQSLTQLKLDLQRISTNREPARAPAVQPPLSGAHASFANLSLIGNERGVDERKQRLWEQAEVEYENGRRFVGVVGKGLERLEKRSKVGGGQAKDGRSGDTKERTAERIKNERHLLTGMSTSVESRSESRGRVRFEVGRGLTGQERGDGDTDSDGGGLEGLLRRMWEGDGHSGGEE